MTEPTQTPTQTGSVQFTFAPVQGPDRKPWVLVTIIQAPLQMQFALPVDSIDVYVQNLESCATEARRAGLGLITPTSTLKGLS